MNREAYECYEESKERVFTLGNEDQIGYEWDQEIQWEEDYGVFLEMQDMFSDSEDKFLPGLSYL